MKAVLDFLLNVGLYVRWLRARRLQAALDAQNKEWARKQWSAPYWAPGHPIYELYKRDHK